MWKNTVEQQRPQMTMYLEDQRDAVLSSIYLFYMPSRVSPAPIIRSTQTVVTTTGTGHAVNYKDII